MDWAVPAGRWLQLDEQELLFGPSHLRMIGALAEIDMFRPGKQGHVFAIAQDPNALSSDETKAKGERRHKSIEEEQDTASIILTPNPAIEAEDVISVGGVSWRVTSFSYRAMWRGDVESGAPVLESSVQLRKCL